VGLGVPVVVEGPWSRPHIYPDIAGILQDPDAADAKLHALGQGLFGKGQGGAAVNSLLQGLGKFLNSGKSDRDDVTQRSRVTTHLARRMRATKRARSCKISSVGNQ
jgi:hypothetical protein